MARLHDPPPASESLESLKRRFVRQNREIARVNSIQSVRIRNLESEVSRLLVENVALREEAISANKELEKANGSPRFGDEISSVKGKLEAKLLELSGLVADLGSLPQKGQHSVAPKPNSEAGGYQTSPAILSRRSGVQGGQSSLISDEDRLPVIMEDRYYPRLTTENEPPLESPSEDNCEQNAFDLALSPATDHILDVPSRSLEDDFPMDPESSPQYSSSLSSSVPSNRERRKRRDSSLLKDITPGAEGATAKSNYDPQSPSSRAGSKRKFGLSEDEEPVLGGRDDDDFQFTRLSTTAAPTPQDTVSVPEMPERQPSLPRPNVQRGKEKTVGRRALGPKSTNTPLRSPVKKLPDGKKPHSTRAKPKTHNATEKEASDIFTYVKEHAPEVIDKQSLRDSSRAQPRERRVATDIKLEDDLDDCQASQDKGASRADADSKANEATIQTRTRQSRRSRGAVSYAEPNLRDKMRRPTEEFVAAVDDRSRRTSKSRGAVDEESIPTSIGNVEQNIHERSNITNEPNWVNESASADPSPGQSTSSIAISTLVAGGKRSRGKRDDTHSRVNNTNSKEGAEVASGSGRQTRRHSANYSIDMDRTFKEPAHIPPSELTSALSRAVQGQLPGDPDREERRKTKHKLYNDQDPPEPSHSQIENETGRRQRTAATRRRINRRRAYTDG